MSTPNTKGSVPVRFAMIGCGRMGRHHSEKLIADGRGKVVAMFDAIPAMAHGLKSELWPNACVAGSFDELLSHDEIDAAIICTPTAEHHSQTLLCLGRDWHVLCEKPLASNRDQIVELLHLSQLARSKGQAFSLGYQRRFASVFLTLRREVLSGKWGAVRAINSHTVEFWQSTIGGTWRDDPQQNPGGFVTDAGSHKLDALFYVTGLKPLEVFARSQKWGSHVEIITSVSALLTENVTATMDFIGNAQHLSEDLHIHCEKGDLMLRHEDLWVAHNKKVEPLVADERDSNPAAGLLDTILEGKPDISPPESALPVYDMTQAILKSGQTGAVVAICE
jgi:predicted dehydrogenase